MSRLVTEGRIRAADVRRGDVVRICNHYRLPERATGTTGSQKSWTWQAISDTSRAWRHVLQVLPGDVEQTPISRWPLVGATATPAEQRQYLSPRYVLLEVSAYNVNDHGAQSMVVAVENFTLVDVQIEEGT